MSGQVESGARGDVIKYYSSLSLSECQQKCEEENGCIAIDYMESYNPYQCRLVRENIPRWYDPGSGDRTYCEIQGKT